MSEPLGEQLSTDLIEHYLRTRGRRYFRGQHDGEYFFVANSDPQRLHVHLGISRWSRDVFTLRVDPACFFPRADADQLAHIADAWNQRNPEIAVAVHGSSDPRRIGVAAHATLRVPKRVSFEQFAAFVDDVINAAIDLFGQLTAITMLPGPAEPLVLDAG